MLGGGTQVGEAVSFVGEILLRKDLFMIVEHARAHLFNLKLKTNAILIREAEARRIRELGVGEVQVSILLRLALWRRLPVRAVPAAPREREAAEVYRHLARLAAIPQRPLDSRPRSHDVLVVLAPRRLHALPRSRLL